MNPAARRRAHRRQLSRPASFQGVIMRPVLRHGFVLVLGVGVGLLLAEWWQRPGAGRAEEKTKGASAEERVRELKLTLPAASKPIATYVPAVRVGDLLFL